MARAIRDPQKTSTWTRIRQTAALALAVTIGTAGAAGAASIELISRANPVPDTFWHSFSPSISSDGRYVLFGSYASNLVPGQVDGNNYSDLFLHDRATGTTTLVSHQAGSPLTVDPRGASYFDAVLSANGRYVVYSSPGTHLVAGTTDTNNVNDVFLWDRVTGATTLVSHAAGTPNVAADGISGRARISADGEWVVFTSHAENLVPGQTEPTVLPGSATTTEDVFLWSRSTGTVTLLSHQSGSPAATANRGASQPEISADGNFIVFESESTDLLSGPPDANSSIDLFVYQRTSGTLSLVSRTIGTGTGLGHSWDSHISADGRFIAFTSLANNLVPGQVDTPNTPDAFLFDRVTGEMRLASHTSASPVSAAGILQYLGLALSADGRALAFISEAHNLVPGQVDTNGESDVFVYDRLSGSVELASHVPASPATATAEPARAAYPSLSADGRFVSFTSDAQDLVAGEPGAPGTEDVFLYDRSDKSVTLVSHGGTSTSTEGNEISTVSILSADGSAIAFSSAMAGLGGAFDPNGFNDVFVYSRSSAEIEVLSRRDPANPAAVTPHGSSTLGEISADGQTILFLSEANGLVPGQIDTPYGIDPFGFPRGTPDAFLYDRAAGKTILLTRSPTSPLLATHLDNEPVLSADGRFAAFTTSVSPVPPFTRRTSLHLYDKTTDTAILVNHTPGAPSEIAPGFPAEVAISADGRYLAYSCNGCILVPGQQDGTPDASPQIDIFLYDRVTDTNTLVSHANGLPVTGGNKPSYGPEISADGRFVAFVSDATNLAAGQSDLPNSQDVFVFDRTTGGIALVSRSASSAAMTGNQRSFGPVISADGRFIAFRSAATNLVPGQADTNDALDIFLWDRIAGTTALVTHASSSPTTAGHLESVHHSFLSLVGSFSADGRFLVYESPATDLVSGVDTNGGTDVFLYDVTTRSNTLVSHALGAPGTAGNKESGKVRISADGSRIGFVSAATDLVAGQTPTGVANLILQDRITGARTLVGPVSPFPPFTNDSFLFPRMSADGRFVAFTSDRPGFVAGDFNANWDVFLYREGSNGPVTVPPCTLFDTRRPADGPALRSGTRKVLAVHGACGVPAGATSVVVKVTVPEPRRRGSLRLTPGDAATPAATLRFPRKRTRTGTFTVPLAADGTLALQATVVGNGAVHAVVEVVGYME